MKKRILAVLMVAAMALCVMTTPSLAIEADGVNTEAELREALTNGGTITLTGSIVATEKLTVPAGVEVVLDLAGYTISMEYEQTKQTKAYALIENYGTLTIQDNSSAGTGKISYTDTGVGGEYASNTISHRGGTLNIQGGTIENLSDETVAANGYPQTIDTYNSSNTVVNITGGTVYCKNYSAIRMFCTASGTNEVNISEGSTIMGAVDFHNVNGSANVGTLNITGGHFVKTANANVLRLVNFGTNLENMKATVSGGTFSGGIGLAGSIKETACLTAAYSVTGGFFAVDPAQCVAEGYAVTYELGVFSVGEKSQNAPNVDTTVSDAESKGEVAEGITGVTAEDVKAAADKTDLLKAAYNLQHDAAIVGSKEEAKTALGVEDDETEITVEVKPYLEVSVQEYVQNAVAGNTLTVEIDALYNVVASAGSNTAVLKEAQPLSVTETVTITVPLPAGFVADTDSPVYVLHYKNGVKAHTYRAVVTEEGGKFFATFENPNGFSTFAFTTQAAFEKTSMVLEEAIDINFWIKKTELNAAAGAYAVVEFNGNTTQILMGDWLTDETGVYHKISFTGVAAKQMCDEIKITVYAADGTAISQTLSYTVGKAIVALHNYIDDADMKDLCVAMLNYGAAAQRAFNYNRNDLATKYLDSLNGANG